MKLKIGFEQTKAVQEYQNLLNVAAAAFGGKKTKENQLPAGVREVRSGAELIAASKGILGLG